LEDNDSQKFEGTFAEKKVKNPINLERALAEESDYSTCNFARR
jgi:hypothetical protein